MERGIRKTLRKERGITLVALVITIVILIILAAVSINVIIEGGLIQRAQRASEDYRKAELKEQIELVRLEVALKEGNKGKVPLEEFLDELVEDGILESKDKVTTDEAGNTVIPTTKGPEVTITTDGEGNVTDITIEGLVVGGTGGNEGTETPNFVEKITLSKKGWE